MLAFRAPWQWPDRVTFEGGDLFHNSGARCRTKAVVGPGSSGCSLVRFEQIEGEAFRPPHWARKMGFVNLPNQSLPGTRGDLRDSYCTDDICSSPGNEPRELYRRLSLSSSELELNRRTAYSRRTCLGDHVTSLCSTSARPLPLLVVLQIQPCWHLAPRSTHPISPSFRASNISAEDIWIAHLSPANNTSTYRHKSCCSTFHACRCTAPRESGSILDHIFIG